MECYINNKKQQLSISQIIGSGGEADIIALKNGDLAKIYKGTNHASYAYDENEKKNANLRLNIIQTKLPALLKLVIPNGVVKPKELIYNENQQIIGYTMDYIKNADMLSKYFKDRRFRQSIDSNKIIDIFKNLYPIVDNIHKQQIVLGDFNDMNVMVEFDGITHIIDFDSSQFENYVCNMFTDTFVDPILCQANPTGKGIILTQRYNENSDWYSFAVMLLRNLLLIHSPFAGVYNPQNKPKIPDSQRALERITIFDSEVKYPGNSIHYNVLPDELLQYFQDTFMHDKRGVLPLSLLESIRWTKCSSCGHEHARNVCPGCAVAAPAVKEVIRGSVTAMNIFRTSGRIVASSYQNGKIQYIYYENGKFKRNNVDLISGNLDPQLVFKTCGDINLFAKKNSLVVLKSNEAPQQISIDCIGSDPLFDTNEFHYFWISGGKLFKNDVFDNHKYIGDVLEGQTRFWVSNELGFGFYQAGGLFQPFIIDVINGGINDNIKIPSIFGHIIDYDCFFTSKYVWFMLTVKEGNQDINRCYVFDNKGNLLLQYKEPYGSHFWLGEIHGHMAIGDNIFSSTEHGILKTDMTGQVIREFPDSIGLLHAGDEIYPSSDGIYVVNDQNIKLLKMKGS